MILTLLLILRFYMYIYIYLHLYLCHHLVAVLKEAIVLDVVDIEALSLVDDGGVLDPDREPNALLILDDVVDVRVSSGEGHQITSLLR
jgi:hypothetical protein